MPEWGKILQIIYKELGKSAGDLFKNFYEGFSAQEQYNGAMDLLTNIRGQKKAKELLKSIKF